MSKKAPKISPRIKQRRRRTLTFMRMCRYGVNNFSRNAWLTVAATAVMSVTLLIIFVTVVAQQLLISTTDSITQQSGISLYLKGSVDDSAVETITKNLKKLSSVTNVSFISSEQARQEQAESKKNDAEFLEAISEASNEMPATIRISIKDLNDYSEIENFTKTDQTYLDNKDTRQEPSFTGRGRTVIDTIGSWVRVASLGGSIATGVFVLISALVVFNTIRMAIFNRKDEIQMMKLIGAEKGFIRGPFIVEAIMYGFIAGIIATAAGYGLMMLAEQPFSSYGLPMAVIMEKLMTYIGLVLFVMIAIGALIGTVSAWVATRKYLKL